MAEFVYLGYGERVYPNILTDTGSLVVETGDTHDFDEPPSDGLWFPYPIGKNDKKDEA